MNAVKIISLVFLIGGTAVSLYSRNALSEVAKTHNELGFLAFGMFFVGAGSLMTLASFLPAKQEEQTQEFDPEA